MEKASARFITFACLIGVSVALHATKPSDTPAKNWAVLVAGSNGWGNYRHQADVCHAYQILMRRGIPKENIITFMYDDIADNDYNPFKGEIYNNYEHKDVYAGVEIDYKGEEVTPEMFIRVMKADSELSAAGKKVLGSGPDDNVFVYFTDHGAEGLIAFPNGLLYARELNETITYMYEHNLYKEMVLYIEACFSGSMFEDILPQNIRVFTTTAANPHESSYAAFCDDTVITTCLADEYSYNWMVDTETHDIHRLSLQQQYCDVKDVTRNSHVMEYGDLSMGSLPIDQFQTHNLKKGGLAMNTVNTKPVHTKRSTTAHVFALMKHAMEAKMEEDHSVAMRKLHRIMQLGTIVKHLFDDIVAEVRKLPEPAEKPSSKLEQLLCFEKVFKVFQNNCFTIQQVPEVAQHVTQFHHLCRTGYQPDVIINSVMNMCT
ncbi:hypothetical protein EG68_06007 [Paragonimus skrjabini miyazakii]|uniref:Hemoglobinase n=1 Tax=Paragonimus skrjabini miyazakii TaxID=59628 RepID=A0A8S9YQW9_9TREM|nr:hypothetical protein EG68_06007 [Paragonimus skrjabini miyazakii]